MNREFSPNMLKTYQTCPMKYFLRYENNISVPQKTTPFEKGSKIHALANYYLKGENISKFEGILTDEEKQIWERLKNNEYFRKTYIKSEYNLSCRVNDFWIGGRLDALVKDGEDYFILDYKTGQIPKNPENDYQTMIYLLSVHKYLKTYNSLTFVYIDLKNNQNHKIELNDKRIEEYTKNLTDICTKITTDKNYSKSANCHYCEYGKICHG